MAFAAKQSRAGNGVGIAIVAESASLFASIRYMLLTNRLLDFGVTDKYIETTKVSRAPQDSKISLINMLLLPIVWLEFPVANHL